MELQFEKQEIDHLRQALGSVKDQELTQEIRLTDTMPDVGRVLAGWGQPVLRSKEWQGSQIGASGGVMVWIVNDATIKGSETGTSFRQALAFKDLGFLLHDTMVWKKSGTAFPDTVRYYANFEYMFVFSKGKPKTIHLIADRPNKCANERITTTERARDGSLRLSSGAKKGRLVKETGIRFNVWDINEEKSNKTGHPAVFPIQLISDHIISWSNPGDIVLDPFMGSGTTALAAIKTKRRYIGFEISEEYCAIAQARIAEILCQQEEETCS